MALFVLNVWLDIRYTIAFAIHYAPKTLLVVLQIECVLTALKIACLVMISKTAQVALQIPVFSIIPVLKNVHKRHTRYKIPFPLFAWHALHHALLA